jgi:uncharacterized protein (TIGR00725 family)
MIVNLAVAASSQSNSRDLAEEFVSGLPPSSRLILGGYWGLMQDVADSAAVRGITVIFTLPIEPKALPPRRSEFIVVDTGMEYRARSVLMCRSCDALVALGGEAGTIIEIFMAYAMGKPVVVLESSRHSTDLLRGSFGSKLDSRNSAKVHYAETPAESARLALKLAQAHNKSEY